MGSRGEGRKPLPASVEEVERGSVSGTFDCVFAIRSVQS